VGSKEDLLLSLRTGGYVSARPKHLGKFRPREDILVQELRKKRAKKLSTEIIEQLREENQRLSNENKELVEKLDNLEKKVFVDDLHQKALMAMYAASRLVARQVPKTKRAKKVLSQARTILVAAGLKPPREFRSKIS
jgi:hypothetical protein